MKMSKITNSEAIDQLLIWLEIAIFSHDNGFEVTDEDLMQMLSYIKRIIKFDNELYLLQKENESLRDQINLLDKENLELKYGR